MTIRWNTVHTPRPTCATRGGAARGFALVELSITLGVMSIMGVLVTTSVFQGLWTSRANSAHIEVADEAARVTRWLLRDSHRAQGVDVTDGGPAAAAATFSWDDSGTPVSCGYAIAGGALWRTCNGNSLEVAAGASALQFTRSGQLLTVSFNLSSAAGGASQTVTIQVLIGGRQA